MSVHNNYQVTGGEVYYTKAKFLNKAWDENAKLTQTLAEQGAAYLVKKQPAAPQKSLAETKAAPIQKPAKNVTFVIPSEYSLIDKITFAKDWLLKQIKLK